MQVTPIYVVSESNTASLKLARRTGFVDTGAREIEAQAALKIPSRETDG